jgi:signal transduction histidine kinase
LRVPIAGSAESLNLAAAATVILFEAARQRAGGDVLSQIVGGAAHDIRSPLTALGGFAKTLVARWDKLDDDQRLMMLEGVTHDAARMEIIVTQLVEAARLTSHRLELSRINTDLLEATVRLRDELLRWGQFDLEVAGESVQALVDPARLRTILIALIESAQWWGQEGPVRLLVGAGGQPVVEVVRSGTELDADGAADLFRPRRPGTGGGSKVGLFVAKGLTESQGGTLEVDTEGAIRFRVRLAPEARATLG